MSNAKAAFFFGAKNISAKLLHNANNSAKSYPSVNIPIVFDSVNTALVIVIHSASGICLMVRAELIAQCSQLPLLARARTF